MYLKKTKKDIRTTGEGQDGSRKLHLEKEVSGNIPKKEKFY